MKLEQMLVLTTIVKEGSFRAASEKLNKVQSAVSYSVKTLEEELGIRLFSRQSYRPSLTPAGRAIYRKAKVMLAEMEDLKALALHLKQGEEPVFRIDIAPTVPMERLVPLLRLVARAHPATRLEITSETFGGESLVAEGKVDLAITDLLTRDTHLETRLWCETKLFAVAAVHHPLAQMGAEEIGQSDVRKHIQVVVSSGRYKKGRGSRGVFEGASTWTVSGFDAKKMLLLSGMGWGNMPEHLIRKELASGSLTRLCIPGLEETTVALHMVRKRSQLHGPVGEELWSVLQEVPKT